jgi:uncharacterized membrane protein YjfL (UPF0719 family)
MEKVTQILFDFLKVIAWSLVGAVSMSISLGILLKVYDMMTPIDEWEEIRKGNIACAIIMAAVIIAFAIVIGMVIASPDTGNIAR